MRINIFHVRREHRVCLIPIKVASHDFHYGRAMAVTNYPLASALSVRAAWPDTLRALFALTKPQLAVMSVLTAMVAFATVRPASGAAFATFAGTLLAAAGALSLNQWWERQADGQMRRTRGRPLPQAKLSPLVALLWSVGLSCAGVVVLAVWVNVAASVVAALTILIYGVVYTPMKRHTRWATEVGAVSGALPPLLGNAAAGELWAAPGVAIFAVLLCWQMPHFFAIGWRHRIDYRAAGFRVLPAVDLTGRRTAAWSLFYAALLVPVSLAPWVSGELGVFYGVPAALAGGAFVTCAWQFFAATDEHEAAARRLFLASIIYLPVVLAALAVDRIAAAF
jgi:protoheme IX farnesyltransferase